VLELVSMPGLTGPVVSGELDSVAVPSRGVVWACDQAIAELIGDGYADMATAQLADSQSGVLRIIAQEGFGRRFLDFFEIVHDDESACGRALVKGRPVWVPDVARSPIFAGTPARDIVLSAGCRSVASVPVLVRDCSFIIISAHRRRPGPWTQLQRHHVEAVAAAIGRLLSR
jgi:GAF domain-containing protein